MTLGQHMGCTDRQLQLLYHSGVVHDIGKIAVPMEILNKPFKLSKEEFDLIKTHVLHSVSILRSVDFCPEVCGIVAAHHERLDGSGYPNGLSSEQISIESRILTVADVFESMTSHRPYRASLGVEPALVELRTGKVTKYDPDVVSVLEEIVCHHDFNQIFGIDI
jgi:HD-GYP domain-containing protein (c-di-GMP phosphodiesterase class II)